MFGGVGGWWDGACCCNWFGFSGVYFGFFFQFLNARLYPVHSRGKCPNPTVVFSFGLLSFISDLRGLCKVGDVMPTPDTFWQCWHNFQYSWGLQFPCRHGQAFPLFLPYWVESLAGSPCFLIMHFFVFLLCFLAGECSSLTV